MPSASLESNSTRASPRTIGRLAQEFQPVQEPASRSATLREASLQQCPSLTLQRAIGNQGLGRILAPKLRISEPGDIYEQEADRVADQVMRSTTTPDHIIGTPPQVQLKCAPCEATGTACPKCEEEEQVLHRSASGDRASPEAPPVVYEVLRSPGDPLDANARAFFEPRFGYDFSNVRVHTDEQAADSARAVGARAYAVGNDVVFGKAEFHPGTASEQGLLAHELVHVIQQGRGAEPLVRRARLADFKDKDKDEKNDPSKLTDAQIEATEEFKSLMDSNLVWQWQDHVTREEALLACRLMLRHLREGQRVVWDSDARTFVNFARDQLGTLRKTEAEVGKLSWVGFRTDIAASDPSKLESDFGKWLLAGGPEPDATAGKVNCWEMIMFSAFKGGFTSKARVQGIYDEAVKQVQAGTRSFVGDTIEVELRRGNEYILDPANPKSPEPLPGDIVIFTKAKNHVAISLGAKDASGRHAVISHWPPPDGSFKTKFTTIEELLASPDMPAGTIVKFWSPKW